MFTDPQVSAAQGAEDFYTTANNHTRQEPVELARKLDKITQQVGFVSHSDLSLITQSFLEFLISIICFKLIK